jgi:transcription antitermination factor NusG
MEHTLTADATLSPMGAYRATPHWYAAYTRARHEKSVARQLGLKQIDHFLPTYRSVRRWKDRRTVVVAPLFDGYIFVRISPGERLDVLKIESVVRLVGFGGTPTPIADSDVEALRQGIAGDAVVEPHPFLKAGQRVAVVGGPLVGSEGFLVRRKNKLRVVLSLGAIMRSVAVEVDEADIAPLR